MEGDATLQQRRALFVEQKARVEAQIAAYQKNLEKIEYKIWYYDRAIERGTEGGDASNCSALEEEYQRLRAQGRL